MHRNKGQFLSVHRLFLHLSTLSQTGILCRDNKQWLVNFFVLAGLGVIRTTIGTSTDNLFSAFECKVATVTLYPSQVVITKSI